MSLEYVQKHGGCIIYLQQEGRGIGIANKIAAYAMQDVGFDTVDANHRLGFETDERVFSPAAAMLKALGLTAVRLMTNNPDKVSQLAKYGIVVLTRMPIQRFVRKRNSSAFHMASCSSDSERLQMRERPT